MLQVKLGITTFFFFAKNYILQCYISISNLNIYIKKWILDDVKGNKQCKIGRIEHHNKISQYWLIGTIEHTETKDHTGTDIHTLSIDRRQTQLRQTQ